MPSSKVKVDNKTYEALRVLKGLRNSGFSHIAQSHEALSQLHLFIVSSSSSATAFSTAMTTRDTAAVEAIDAVPMLLGFAGTALLHLQQQPFLQAPAADLATITRICECLATTIALPSSTPAMAKRAQQQTLDSRAGAFMPCFCF
jgi:hypothetical protein